MREISYEYPLSHLAGRLYLKTLKRQYITVGLTAAYLLFGLVWYLVKKEVWSLGLIDVFIYVMLGGRILSDFIGTARKIHRLKHLNVTLRLEKESLEVVMEESGSASTTNVDWSTISLKEVKKGVELRGGKLCLLIPSEALTPADLSQLRRRASGGKKPAGKKKNRL